MTTFVLLEIESDDEAADLIEDSREYPDSPLLTPTQERVVYATIVSPHKRPGAAPLNFPTSVRADLRNMRGLGARVAESVRWSA